jgi:hypothetical protein
MTVIHTLFQAQVVPMLFSSSKKFQVAQTSERGWTRGLCHLKFFGALADLIVLHIIYKYIYETSVG